MNETVEVVDGPVARWTSVGFSAVLALSAAVTLGYWSARAFGKADNEAMESPLMLSVARQLVYGPGGLYGPFGRTNPLVLIHAPFYYRAAALLAWPMVRIGLDPVEAARVAGRSLSFAGLIATAIAAARLARLGGSRRRAGWWAAGLVVSAPVLTGIPYAVRPDMLGVACQTWAVALAAGCLIGRTATPQRGWCMVLASVLFGLSACVKQHLVAAWAVTAVWAALAWLRGRAALGFLALAVIPGVAVTVLIYGIEWYETSGRVLQAAFVAASSVARVHPGSWDSVIVVSLGILNRSAGMVTLLCAAPAAAAAARGGVPRMIVATAGTLAVGMVLAALVIHALTPLDSPQIARRGAFIVIYLLICILAALPGVTLSVDRRDPGSETGVPLGWYLAAELAVVVFLARQSSGAWLNYAIPATAFAAALAGRALSRSWTSASRPWAMLPVGLALLTLLVACLSGLAEDRRHDRGERGDIEQIFGHIKRDRPACYFTNRPGVNRLEGRLELVHDDWLYPVFERIGMAEPRSGWLGHALGPHGPVRVVVATSPDQRIEGTSLDLRRLGYRADIRVGPFYVWIR